VTAFLAIVGPTGSGKTDLSVVLARRLDGEIVSMDSRQVYRGMDIGTDKVDEAVRAEIPHHGLDLLEPAERYSAGRFAREARVWVADIVERGRVPILVGGTGFFLRALASPMFREPELDERRLGDLRSWLRIQPRERLETWVRGLDPSRARLAIEGGPQRMGRAIEVALLSGRSLSYWHRQAPTEGEALSGVVIVLDLPRDEMDRRIADRVARMADRGLVGEVRALLSAGFGPDAPGMTATGYREIVRYLDGTCTLDEALDMIRRRTRQYARRQLTWFRNQLPPSARVVSALLPVSEQARLALAVWQTATRDPRWGKSSGGKG
jgi:tRNA dimethylallyltransferase